MTRTKRISALALFLAAIMLFSAILAACGNKDTKNDPAKSTESKKSGSGFMTLGEGFTDVRIIDEYSAIEAVASVADTLGVKDAHEELKVERVDEVDGETFYRMRQYHNGIPVYGKNIIVAADAEGASDGLASYYTAPEQTPDFRVAATDESIEKALKAYYADTFVSVDYISDEVVWYDADGTFKPVFETSVITTEGSFKALVNVENSTVEYSVSTTFTAGSPAECYNADRSLSFTGYYDSDDKKYQMYNESLALYVLSFNKTNSQSRNSKQTFIKSSDELFGNSADERALETDKAVEMMINTANIRSYFKNTLNANADRYLFCYYNDQYDSGDNGYAGLRHSDGSVIPTGLPVGVISIGTNNSLSAIDLLGHEYMHRVEQNISNMDYINESGSLMEAYSDIFGELCELYICGSTDWKQNGGIRDLIDPSKSTEGNRAHPTSYRDSNWYNGSGDGGGVHHNSTVISHAAYLMWNGIDGTEEKKIDADILAQMWIRSLHMLNSDSTFTRCAEAVILSSRQLYRAGVIKSKEQLDCVREAFAKVGVKNALSGGNGNDPGPSGKMLLTPAEAVNVYLEYKDLWMIDSQYLYDGSGACYLFLDFDFDGVLELVSTVCMGSGHYSHNKFYRIDLDKLKVVEILENDNSETYQNEDGYDLIVEDSVALMKGTDGKLFYYCSDFSRPGFGCYGEIYGKLYMKSYKMIGEGIHAEEYDGSGEGLLGDGSKEYYYYWNEGGRFVEVEEDDYNERLENFKAENKDMGLTFGKISGQDYYEALESGRRLSLLKAYLAFSYNGFSFDDEEPDEPDVPEDGYEWVIEPSIKADDIYPVATRYKDYYCDWINYSVIETSEGYGLISYDGETVLEPGEYSLWYCMWDNIITDIANPVFTFYPDTGKMTSEYHYGHGGPRVIEYYYYDNDVYYYEDVGVLVKASEPYCVAEEASEYEEPYEEGVYLTGEGRYGIIVDGRIAVPFDYDYGTIFSDDVACLGKNGRYSYFDQNGDPLFSEKFDSHYYASEGTITLCIGGKWGFADTSGNMITALCFEEARPVYNGMAWVKKDGKWGVVRLTPGN